MIEVKNKATFDNRKTSSTVKLSSNLNTSSNEKSAGGSALFASNTKREGNNISCAIPKNNSAVRIYFLIAVVLIFAFLIIFKLYFLQVKKYQAYKEIAQDQHLIEKKILPFRGEIFIKEKNGDNFLLATNLNLDTVFVVPKEIENPFEIAKKIADTLSINQDQVLEKVSKKEDSYEVIKRKLSEEESQKIKDLKLKGVYLEKEIWRYYPGGSLASNVVGFLGNGENGVEGRYGIERQFEEELKGKEGMLKQERDIFGQWISLGDKKDIVAENGTGLVLTLDHVLQFKVETALKNAIKKHGADSGKIIIMDPKTGKILAMAAWPEFDPNEYSKVENVSIFANPNVSGEYECGSVFKAITMAMGLDSKKVSPNTVYTDIGKVEEPGFTKPIENSDGKAYGTQTMTNVLEKSLNTGVIFVEKQVGKEAFLSYIKNFNFGGKTGIDLPGEINGNISNLKSNRNIEYYTASFGQGITVTPIQLAAAYVALASGGDYLKPQIVDYKIKNIVKDSENQNQIQKTEVTEKEILRKVISKEAAEQLALMLESNVLNGHGKLAGVPGYRVAGKTGTAQVPDRKNGGYLKNVTTGTFAGFGPVDDPAFVMVVIIDNPKDVEWAESTAAPVFGALAKFMFDYWGIKPTKDFTDKEMEDFSQKHDYIFVETNKK